MQDEDLIALYWQRDEAAIGRTEEKYGRYLAKIAHNILGDYEDSRECVNDVYLKAWDAMPPHWPHSLSAFLGRIARQRAIDLFRTRNRQKRKTSEYAISLSELEECVPAGTSTEEKVDLQLLMEAIRSYLATLPAEARTLFVGRYYYLDSLRDVAAYWGTSESKAKSMLHRTRKGLKAYLEQEGLL